MHQIRVRKARMLMPSQWSEIRMKDWKLIAPFILNNNPFNRSLVLDLIRPKNIFQYFRLPYSWKELVSTEQLASLFDCVEWMQTPSPSPPINSFRHRGKRYYFPKAKLSNITIIEFAALDLCFNVYRDAAEKGEHDRAEMFLNKLVGYMCRPADRTVSMTDAHNFRGDVREPFNSAVCDGRAKTVAKFPDHIRIACVLFFTSCKQHIYNMYKHPLFEGGSGKPNARYWLDAASKMAGGKFGTLEQTRFTNLYDFLDEMKEQVIESKKKTVGKS